MVDLISSTEKKKSLIFRELRLNSKPSFSLVTCLPMKVIFFVWDTFLQKKELKDSSIRSL